MKKLAVALTIIALSSCGGGTANSGTGNNDKNSAVGSVTNSDTSLSIVGDNQMQTINKTQKTSVKITGDSNGIVIKSNISELRIVGDENTIDITAGVTIDECNVIGDSNTLTKLSGQSVNCKVIGDSNKGFN